MASTSAENAPISTLRLKQIATDACDSTLERVSNYDHSSTESWNTQIINKILHSILSETSATKTQAYKYVVNSTIIQHLSDPAPQLPPSTRDPAVSAETQTAGSIAAGSGADMRGEPDMAPATVDEDQKASSGQPAQSSLTARSKLAGNAQRQVGRRGMHSATGAYWNNEKDGIWSFKYEGGEDKGMDMVVNVVWVSIC